MDNNMKSIPSLTNHNSRFPDGSFLAELREEAEAFLSSPEDLASEAVKCLHRNLTCGQPRFEILAADMLLQFTSAAL